MDDLQLGNDSPASSTPTGTRGRKARGGFAITPQLLPDGDCPMDAVQVPVAARDVRRYVLDGYERISWRCHVRDGYNIDFSVKILLGARLIEAVPVARLEKIDGYLDFGGEHDNILSGLRGQIQPILVLEFDNNFSYFTPKHIELHVSKRCGAPRSVEGYTEAIVACESNANIGCASRLFDRMSDLGIQPNLGSYKALLVVCKAAGDADYSVRLLADMKKMGILPNADCYNIAIATCENCGQAQTALSIMDEMSEEQIEQGSTVCAALQLDHRQTEKLDWIKWALDEAKQVCPDGAVELRCHLESARKSLEAYMTMSVKQTAS